MKKKPILLLTILTATIILITLTSCAFMDRSSLTFEMPEQEQYEAGFNYVDVANLNAAQVEETVPEEDRTLELELDENYEVSYQTVKATASYDDLCGYGVNSDILYPGAIVDTRNNAYTPITVSRAPITISANLETMTGVEGSLSAEIEDPSLSSYREGVRTIIQQNITEDGGQLPSDLSIDVREVKDSNEFMLNLGLGLQVSKFHLSEKFEMSNIKQQTNLAIVIKQVYYTVDMDYPGIDGFFSTFEKNENIENAFKDTVPAYVSSVSYGRIAIITIQSNYSKDEITNALSLGWGKMSENPGSSAAKGFAISFDNTIKNICQDSNTTVNCFIYGGGSDMSQSAVQISSNATDVINSVFSTFNAAGSVGLPISYKLRNMDGSLLKIQDADEYTIKNVKYKPNRIMKWDYLNNLLQSGEILKQDNLSIDFSAMVDYTAGVQVDDEGNTSDPMVAQLAANRTIKIPENIKTLHLIGPNAYAELKCTDLSIDVAHRTADNPLTIKLTNIYFSADSKWKDDNGVLVGAAIRSDNDSKLILDIKGNVTIEGTKTAIVAEKLEIIGNGNCVVKGGADGQAINCDKDCVVDMQGKLSLTGGTGSKGSNTAGYNRETNTQANVNNPGRNGGQGGTGTKGATAMIATSLTIKNAEKLHLYLEGGTGGVGGRGGDGEFASRHTSQAGHGGKGGTGGQGGDLLQVGSITCQGVLKEFTGKKGNGGQGGVGGNGGHADRTTTPGVDWGGSLPGEGGAAGSGGAGGLVGSYNSSVLPASIVNIIEGTVGAVGTAGSRGDKDHY